MAHLAARRCFVQCNLGSGPYASCGYTTSELVCCTLVHKRAPAAINTCNSFSKFRSCYPRRYSLHHTSYMSSITALETCRPCTMFLKRRSAPAARTRDASRADAVSLTPPPGLAVVRCSRSHACNVASVSGGGAAGSSHCCGWFGWLGCHPHGTKLAVKNSMARRRCCRHAFGRACSQRLHLGHTWCVAEQRPPGASARPCCARGRRLGTATRPLPRQARRRRTAAGILDDASPRPGTMVPRRAASRRRPSMGPEDFARQRKKSFRAVRSLTHFSQRKASTSASGWAWPGFLHRTILL